MPRTEIIGDATLILGDCREILPGLAGVDAVVTDPPYGVAFRGKATKHTTNRPDSTYIDDEANFRTVVIPAVAVCVTTFPRALIFCGARRAQEYPAAADIGGIICPNGGGMSPWGFSCYHPVLFYGISPYLVAGLGSRPTVKALYHPGMHVTGEAIGNDHPCPKPIAFMNWAIETASLERQVVLDPFMGSGTTGVACARLGRRFTGIEIHEPYFDIACRRIEAAQRQKDLFVHMPVAEDPADARLADLFEEPAA